MKRNHLSLVMIVSDHFKKENSVIKKNNYFKKIKRSGVFGFLICGAIVNIEETQFLYMKMKIPKPLITCESCSNFLFTQLLSSTIMVQIFPAHQILTFSKSYNPPLFEG